MVLRAFVRYLLPRWGKTILRKNTNPGLKSFLDEIPLINSVPRVFRSICTSRLLIYFTPEKGASIHKAEMNEIGRSCCRLKKTVFEKESSVKGSFILMSRVALGLLGQKARKRDEEFQKDCRLWARKLRAN